MNINVKRPSLSDEALSRFIDPRTGQRLRPLGVVGGRTVWPIMGSSPDDPSLDDEDETKDKSGGPEGGTSSEETGTKDTGDGDPQAKIAALNEEKDRHVRRRREAETEKERLQAELDELKGKDQSELQKTTARVTALESENSALQESLRTARLENAFLASNEYEWHNPGRALALADLSEVEIDEDGKVHGLTAALKALAKSDAYLLKNKEKENDDQQEDLPGTQVTNPPKKGTKAAQEREAVLRDKYSALRR